MIFCNERGSFSSKDSLKLLLYDTYHPVVDYTNLLVVGITSALAWELPSQPVYLEDELQEIYNNGSLPLLRRNDDNVEINRFQDENVAGNILFSLTFYRNEGGP